MGDRIILHSDFNNFYASVECLFNPILRGKPVAVAGDVQERHGIVLAKNDLAKQHGVSTGDPLWLARQKCPEIVFTPPHFDRYLRCAKTARDIYAQYTDQVESYGLDECWMDVTGSTRLFGGGRQIADEIRSRIKSELGITASIGVSFNKVFAKLGSDMKKPDATTVIDREHFKQVVWPLPASDLLFVGRATAARLARLGVHTIGQLAQTSQNTLKSILGKNGLMLWSFANGHDTSPVSRQGGRLLIKSVGNGTTAPRDLISDQDIRITLYILCESVAERLRENHFVAGTLQLGIRDSSLFSCVRQAPLPYRTASAQELFQTAYGLCRRHHRAGAPIRSLHVRACNLSIQDSVQLSLLPEQVAREKRDRLEEAVDGIRRRYGHFAVQRAVMLADPQLAKLDPRKDHAAHPEPFRKQ